MLGELFSTVAPLYLCAGTGYAWVRAGRRYDTELISELCTWIGAPCLVFSSLSGIELAPRALSQMLVAVLLAHAAFLGIAALALAAARQPARSFLAPMVFPNTGNMGLAVCLFAFGQEGLALGVCFFAVSSLLHFTAGQWIWSGEVSLVDPLKTPLSYAALLGGAAWLTETDLPLWLSRTVETLGAFTIPLMQLTLGASLGRLAVSGLGRGLALSALRIGMGVVVGAALAWLLGLEGIARGVLILDCAMPVAVFNYLMAERYRRSPEEVAGLVVLSTLLSFVTLPLLLAWVL